MSGVALTMRHGLGCQSSYGKNGHKKENEHPAGAYAPKGHCTLYILTSKAINGRERQEKRKKNEKREKKREK